ncbi:MAG: glutamate synthase-related protein [Candidatus Bathyarchaeia archaeon]
MRLFHSSIQWSEQILEQTKSIGSGNSAFALRPNSGYHRFKIETHEAPPRRKQPRPFNPRVSKIGLASVLISEALKLRLKLTRKEYRKMLLSRPCIYGVFGSKLGGFHPIKDKCVGCMRCVQEYPGVCVVDRNPEFFKFADSYWVPDDPSTSNSTPVSIVAYEAETGKIPIKGMGYKGAFAGRGWDSIWTDMSEIVRPTRDGVYGREYISTTVDVGRKPRFLEFAGKDVKQESRVVEISLPIIFDYLPPNLNNQSIIGSIAGAAQRTGTLFVATPEQSESLPATNLNSLVPLVSAQNLTRHGCGSNNAVMIELTNYDAETVEQIRRMKPKTPISVRLPLSSDAGRIATELVRAGVDVVHLCANYHGEGWDVGSPIFAKDLMRSVHGKLVEESVRDEVTLILSGGVTLAEHIPKAIMCGADLVALEATTLVALQAQFLGECPSPEQGRIKPDKFSQRWGEQRLVNLLASWHDQLIEILSAMGIRDVRRLRGDVGRAMFNEDLEREAFAGIDRRK